VSYDLIKAFSGTANGEIKVVFLNNAMITWVLLLRWSEPYVVNACGECPLRYWSEPLIHQEWARPFRESISKYCFQHGAKLYFVLALASPPQPLHPKVKCWYDHPDVIIRMKWHCGLKSRPPYWDICTIDYNCIGISVCQCNLVLSHNAFDVWVLSSITYTT
jgi:hypothetical protein